MSANTNMPDVDDVGRFGDQSAASNRKPHDMATARRKVERADWEQLKRILADAMEQKTPNARAAFIQQACGGDTTLLREGESLLKEAERMLSANEDEFDDCADNLSTLRRRDEPSASGQRIGAYEVVDEIGRGGMGAVYLAERADGQFSKQVAIKILKRGTDTDDILRRFAAERQILARLDHRNIAHLLDAGTTDEGLPYFVMEYVSGVPATQFVRDRQLAITDRLKLFLKICAAVEFAHKHHVIHRDLKPRNILVTPEGEPKLLDFGIAKLLSPNDAATDVTVTAQQHLTPNCASPEQARGERVTAASDIYALGALLYELLTAQSPHRFATLHPSREELARVVCDETPPKPSDVVADHDLKRHLRGDLDTIVLFAMRKEPPRRYASAKEFAHDVSRHLAGEAVRARPNTVGYRMRHALKRTRATAQRFIWVAAGFCVALVAIALLSSTDPTLRQLLNFGGRAPARATPEKSVAVLPFRNLTEQKENAFFAVGVQDQILTDLAKVADLKVISRTSVEQYKTDQRRNLREIGELLGVAHVVEGTVQRVGQRVRVSVKLIDTHTDAQLWSESYDRDLVDVFAIQSEIAETIVGQLQAKLLPREKADIEERPTGDLVAYDLYLRAKELVVSYLDAEDQSASLLQAIRLLGEATERDPNFMLAYCYLGRAHGLLYGLRLDQSAERARQAVHAVQTALRLRPNSPEAHLAMADVHYRCAQGFALVEKELEIARPGLPNSSYLHVLTGSIHRRRGRWEEAERSYARAVELDPRNTNAVNLLADNQVLMRHYADAVRTYQRAIHVGLGSPILKLRIAIAEFAADGDVHKLSRALAAAPQDLDVGGGETPLRILVALAGNDFDGALRLLAASPRNEFQEVDFTFYYPRAWYEGLIAQTRGDKPAAEAAFRVAREILSGWAKNMAGDGRTLAVLAQVDAYLGHKELALEEAMRAAKAQPVELDAYEGPLVLQSLAQVYAWSGEKQRALEVLRRLISIPGYVSYGSLKAERLWDPLRDEPGFDGIVAALAPKG